MSKISETNNLTSTCLVTCVMSFALITVSLLVYFLVPSDPVGGQTVEETPVLYVDLNSEEDDLSVEFQDYFTERTLNNKTDDGLILYRQPLSRAAVEWFYYQITGNKNVTQAILSEAEKNNAEIETSEKELYIDVTSKKCNIACFNRKISKIELYIPENYDKELKIEGTSGDIKISEFKNMNVEINQSSGDTEITNVKKAIINASSGDIKIDTIIENAELKTSSGDITADKIGNANLKTSSGDIELKEAQTASITTTSGDIKVNTIEESAELETTSGDITANKITNAKIKTSSGEIELGNVKEYIEAETSSGDIKIDDLEITKDSKIEARSGDVTIHKTNDIYTETKTSSGDSKIENNNRKSEITLKIETSSGDIKVK